MEVIKRFIIGNPLLPYFSIFGGLLLLSSQSTLMADDVAERNSLLIEMILPVSILLIMIGALLRFYRANQEGTLKFFLYKMIIGIIIIAAMMATDVIHTPTVLQNIF